MTKNRLYTKWKGIKQRCDGTSGTKSHKNYFARGIKYDSTWGNFDGFYKDMAQAYYDKGGDSVLLHIDRIDNDKGYDKGNCRWSTPKESQNNRRNNVIVNGKTIAQWGELLKLNKREINTIYKRYSKWGARDYDEVFSRGRLQHLRARDRGYLPCTNCGTLGGTIRKHGGYPHRVKGQCNTCYMKIYRNRLTIT